MNFKIFPKKSNAHKKRSSIVPKILVNLTPYIVKNSPHPLKEGARAFKHLFRCTAQRLHPVFEFFPAVRTVIVRNPITQKFNFAFTKRTAIKVAQQTMKNHSVWHANHKSQPCRYCGIHYQYNHKHAVTDHVYHFQTRKQYPLFHLLPYQRGIIGRKQFNRPNKLSVYSFCIERFQPIYIIAAAVDVPFQSERCR